MCSKRVLCHVLNAARASKHSVDTHCSGTGCAVTNTGQNGLMHPASIPIIGQTCRKGASALLAALTNQERNVAAHRALRAAFGRIRKKKSCSSRYCSEE